MVQAYPTGERLRKQGPDLLFVDPGESFSQARRYGLAAGRGLAPAVGIAGVQFGKGEVICGAQERFRRSLPDSFYAAIFPCYLNQCCFPGGIRDGDIGTSGDQDTRQGLHSFIHVPAAIQHDTRTTNGY